MPKTDLQRHIDKLVKEHGGLRAAAKARGLDPGYLWRMKMGIKKHPTPETLEKLGLQMIQTLRPL